MTAGLYVGLLLFSGIGSVLRFLVDRAVARRTARSFPIGTLTVNLSGAVMLGLVTSLGLSEKAAMLAGPVFVGAYTTFSTWMLETERLGEERQFWPAAVNIVASTVLGMCAVLLGQWVGTLW